MEMVLDLLTWVFVLGGGFFAVTGGIGVLRLPDVYTRLHASGMTDTMGAGLILTGLMFQAGLSLVTVKLIVVLFFLWFTSPIATHSVARAALHVGVRPITGRRESITARQAVDSGRGREPGRRDGGAGRTGGVAGTRKDRTDRQDEGAGRRDGFADRRGER